MNVISIDTAGPVIGVGLATAAGTFCRTERIQRGADARLVPWVHEVLEEANLAISEVSGVAVASGPGSFTGLRVGMAVGMGLSQALDIPVWGAPSWVHRAHAVDAASVLVLLDARKGRVYAAHVCDGILVNGPVDMEPETVLAWPLPSDTQVTGEGARVYQSLIQSRALTIVGEPSTPSVGALAELGILAFQEGVGERAFTLRPQYLRDADAKKPTKK